MIQATTLFWRKCVIMAFLSVAIVGRPNVGKSTLFNRLVGSRIAIEAPVAGVTRDRVLYPLTIEDRTFDLIDTGGIGIVDKQKLESSVELQIDVAINEASVILFLVDIRYGVVPLDIEVARRLRRVTDKVIMVATKADTDRIETNQPSFHELGYGDVVAVSAKENRNIDELEEAILAKLPEAEEEEEPISGRDLLKIAFIGRRNVGKSSIVNQICGGARVIVSDIPGTTRDSVDVIVERDGEKFVAIDTAGLRRRGQMDDMMEFYGHMRSERALRRADVIILMVDATSEISKVEKRIGSQIMENKKPCLLALNKWDLVREEKPDITLADFQEYISDNLPGMYFCRMAGISAKTGENVWNLVAAARELFEQGEGEVRTAQVNTAVANAMRKRRPKPFMGKIGKIYYGTQVGVTPPTFLLFCNNPLAFEENYLRYLEHQLRDELGFPEVPIKLVLKSQKEVGRYE